MALQSAETGCTLKVIETERRTLVWTSAPCKLPQFQLRYDVQHEVVGSTVLAPLVTLFLSRSWVLRQYLEDNLFSVFN